MTNGQSLVDAMDAVKGIKDHLPAGTVIECAAGMANLDGSAGLCQTNARRRGIVAYGVPARAVFMG